MFWSKQHSESNKKTPRLLNRKRKTNEMWMAERIWKYGKWTFRNLKRAQIFHSLFNSNFSILMERSTERIWKIELPSYASRVTSGAYSHFSPANAFNFQFPFICTQIHENTKSNTHNFFGSLLLSYHFLFPFSVVAIPMFTSDGESVYYLFICPRLLCSIHNYEYTHR